MTSTLTPRDALERLLGAQRIAERTLGGRVVPEARPASEDELRETLRLAARERWRVLPVGLGSKLGWRPPVGEVALALSTRALAGVVAYEPGDGTLSARAGTTLAELEQVVRAGGHVLTPWVSRAHESTLGGALAAGQSGFDRTRFGPARVHVLGARCAQADGSVARSGGRLVKNVTGFDLHRLWCGSHGTLGVLVEATLRLFPAPQARALARWSARDGRALLGLARALADAPVRALALVLVFAEDGAGTLELALAGRESVLEEELALASSLQAGAELLRGEAAARAHEQLRERERDAQGRWPARRIGCTRGLLEARVSELLPHAALLVVQPALAQVDAWTRARASEAPAALVCEPDARGAAAHALEARLRASFDPQGLFAARAGWSLA